MSSKAFASGIFILTLAAAGAAFGQAAAPNGGASTEPAVLKSGPHVFKLTNAGKRGIQAVYAAPSGSLDLSDDLLGKQTAAAGKTVTLKVNDKAGACVFDLQFLMNDGDAVDLKGVDLCKSAAVNYGG